jgi:uncharacterized protein YceK
VGEVVKNEEIYNLVFLMVTLMLSACHSIDSKTEKNHLSGEMPPSAYIEIDNKRFETKLGTYCW